MLGDSFQFEASFGGKGYCYSASLSDKAACATALSKVRTIVAERIFDYAPFSDRKALERKAEALGAPKVSSPQGLAALLSAVSVSAMERDFDPLIVRQAPNPDKPDSAVAEQRKVGYATCLFLYSCFKPAFKDVVAQPEGSCPAGTLRLMANSPSWTVVKKANLSQWPAPEVLSAMIGMLSTVVRKESEFACKDDADFDAESQALFGQFFKRKSFGKLVEALNAVPREKVLASAKRIAREERFVPQVERLLYLSAFSLSGYSPYPDPELLAQTFPQLKIPKPRGNYGGKKKKK